MDEKKKPEFQIIGETNNTKWISLAYKFYFLDTQDKLADKTSPFSIIF